MASPGHESESKHILDFIDSVPSLIHTARPDGYIDYFNRQWLEYVGLPLEEILGWKWTVAIHPQDIDGILNKWRRSLETGEPFLYETRVRRADGQYRSMLHRKVAIRDEAGRIVKWYGSSIDIEERKEAEFYLGEAQRLTHIASWVWNVADRSATHLSDEWYRIYGFDPAEGPPDWNQRLDRIHPEDRLKWTDAIEQAIREKAHYDVDFRILHPDGNVRWVHTVGHPVLTGAGDVSHFIGTSTEITQRKQAEQKLKEQEMELRQILDFMPQYIAVLGPDGSPLYINRRGLEYFGIDIDQWRSGGATLDRVHPDDREHFASARIKRLFDGEPHEFEARMKRHDGEYRYFLFRRHPVKDAQGHVTRWLVTATDIEQLKQAEDRLRNENAALREEVDQTSMFEEIVGTSPALQAVLARVSKVAPSDSTVLITGETGTGKELVARAIHRRSRRVSRPFVSVNCAAIPRDLIASELFGHEKGAFTGATQRRLGRFELADGGTIFLDEVGELSPETQVALLRVLQERELERVGGERLIHVDVRVIAATNRDLTTAVADGTFRQDLFYRLNVFPIEMPALRERNEDILMLVEYFVQRYASRAGKNIRSIDKQTLDLLRRYDWPGNIRELQNVIERSVILSSGGVFSVDELWLSKESAAPKPRVKESIFLAAEGEPRSEREIIEAALAETRGRVSGPAGAAAKLRVPPSTLDNRIKALNINKKQFRFA